MKKRSYWTGTRIRQERMRHNLTQQELAEALGCRQQTISEWELGWYEPKNAYSRILTHFFSSMGQVKQ